MIAFFGDEMSYIKPFILCCCFTWFVHDRNVGHTAQPIDKELNDYMVSFKKDMHNLGIPYYNMAPINDISFAPEIVFSEMKTDQVFVGTCFTPAINIPFSIMGIGPKTLVFNKKYWDWYSHDERKSLVYHELMHCVLGLPNHDPEPNHIFSPSMPSMPLNWNYEMLRLRDISCANGLCK
jgi:hypothetical protein